MSKFTDLIDGAAPSRPRGKVVEFWIDCQERGCDEEVGEVEFFPNEEAILYTCPMGHKNIIENWKVPL
jgi:hypothetical protein